MQIPTTVARSTMQRPVYTAFEGDSDCKTLIFSDGRLIS